MNLKRLLVHIRVLGLRNGLTYWRIERACRQEPQRVLEWANRCKKEGDRCHLRGDHLGAFCMSTWEHSLRAAHKAFMGNGGKMKTGGETGQSR